MEIDKAEVIIYFWNFYFICYKFKNFEYLFMMKVDRYKTLLLK